MHIFVSSCDECSNLSQVPENIANDLLDDRKAHPSTNPVVIGPCSIIREQATGEVTCFGQEVLLGVIELLVPWEISKS